MKEKISHISYTDNGFVDRLYFEFPDSSIREVQFNRNGIKTVDFYVNEIGYLHREDGPAEYKYREYPSFWHSWRWLQNGECHRDNGPAHIHFNQVPSGTFKKSDWYQNGEIHRYDGPASIVDNLDGATGWKGYFINGVGIPVEDYENFVKDNEIDLENLTPKDISLLKMKFYE